ncbi:MAG: hypothetical protein IMF01_09365 [Proteobacteria bacterium]|nr:hypothetical protein [Pseudomonadota bacterium]
MKKDLLKLLTDFLSGLILNSKNGWAYGKVWALSFLKGSAVKFAIKKILGNALAGGLRGWLIKFITTELFEILAEPIINQVFRKTHYQYNRIDGKIIIKRKKKAEESGNDQDYDDAIDDLFE